MRKSLILAAAIALAAPAISSAALVYYVPPAGTNSGTNPAGGTNDGTGVWFNVLTGYAEVRGLIFPSPLFADGQYFLFSDGRFEGNPANVFTQGFFARGNGVIYTSSTNLNPARFAVGDVIGPGTGFQSPGAGFPDLGPNFGNWPTPGQGFLGFTIRDPAGTSSSDIFYGFADITVEDDYSITLNAFGYENVRGQSLTIPQPVIKGDFGGAESPDGSINSPDGVFSEFDVEGFLLALNTEASYLALNPTLTNSLVARGDFGGGDSIDGSANSPDGEFNEFDVEGFLLALNDPAGYAAIQPPSLGRVSAIPEPTALGLLLPALILGHRRRTWCDPRRRMG